MSEKTEGRDETGRALSPLVTMGKRSCRGASKGGKTYQETYDEFWKDIVEKLGGVDMEQVKKELHDFGILLSNVPKVYEYITGGMLSKPMTDPDVIITMAEDKFNEDYAETVQDEIKCFLNQDLGLNQVLEELEAWRTLGENLRDGVDHATCMKDAANLLGKQETPDEKSEEVKG